MLAEIHNKSLELKKHVNAIHCSNNLTLVQRKLFNALLFNAYPDLDNQTFFKIQTRELCRLIGYNSNDYAKLKRALLGLISIAIEWNVIDCITGKESKWKASAILASAQIESGNCIYEYSQIMKQLLYQPEIYGRINIQLMAQYKSSYGLALYENCIRYQGLPQTPWFTLEIFRKLMGVFGDKYMAFKDFKKRVLNIAVKEVNTIAPIIIVPEYEKINHKVLRIRFKLSSNSSDFVKSSKSTVIEENLSYELKNTFGLSQTVIQDILIKHESHYIKEKMKLILESGSYTGGKIKGLAGYLLQALKNDYQPALSSFKNQSISRKLKSEEIKKERQNKEIFEKKYQHYLQRSISKFTELLDSEQYQILVKDFEDYLATENTVLQGWYDKHKFDHPGTRSVYSLFIRKRYPNNFADLLSFDQFIDLMSSCEI